MESVARPWSGSGVTYPTENSMYVLMKRNPKHRLLSVAFHKAAYLARYCLLYT